MEKVYIAVNGDNVGERIGSAIASDDYEGLDKLSQNVKDSHGMIEQWVESKGGRTITSTGDEGIYEIPVESCGELEDIKNQYQEMSGNTLTIGVGSNMSEASKSLIYGKLNEKDQIVEYFPEIESYLSEDDSEEIPEGELPESKTIDEGRESELEEEAGLESLPEDIEGGIEEELPPEDGEFPPEEGGEELIPEHEKDMTPEEGFEHDANENAEDELDPDIIEADEEKADEGVLPEDASPEEMDAELDGEDELQPEDVASGDLGEEELEGEELEGEELEGEELEGDGEDDRYNMLNDMIHGHLGEEDGPESDGDFEDGGDFEEDVDPEDGISDEDELKQDIFNALQGFKEHREILEDAKESNPKLYQSLITMLRSMIQMAKQVNYDPEEDLEEAGIQDDIEANFPEAGGEGDFEEEVGEDTEEDIEPEGEEGINAPEHDVKKKPEIK